MEALLKHIADLDYAAILKHNISLDDTQRLDIMQRLRRLNPYSDADFPRPKLTGQKFYNYNSNISHAFPYALITLLRDKSELKQAMIIQDEWERTPMAILATEKVQEIESFLNSLPDNRFFSDLIKQYQKEGGFLSFPMLWNFYKRGWIAFDQDRFVKTLLEIPMFTRNVSRDADFLLQNPEAIEQVLLKLYTVEAKVLDLSKWESDNPNRKTNELGAAKVTSYWDEVFEILQNKGYQVPRYFVTNLMESLLNHWKKPHLDWHCRLIDFFNPTAEELLAGQQYLFAVLGTGQVSLINYVIGKIQSIATEKEFNKQAFLDNFPLTFSVEKCAKSILVGLSVLEDIFKVSSPEMLYREQLAVLLMNPDAKLQEKTAHLLLQFFKNDSLNEVLMPYESYLKEKTKAIFTKEGFLSGGNTELMTLNTETAVSGSSKTAGNNKTAVEGSSKTGENTETAAGGSSKTAGNNKTAVEGSSKTAGNTETAVDNALILYRNAQNFTEIKALKTWDELLFHIGDCIRDKKPADIDIFFDALIRLQDEIPADYDKQIKPYIKQLNREWGDITTMPIMLEFLLAWTEKRPFTNDFDKEKELKYINSIAGKVSESEYNRIYSNFWRKDRYLYSKNKSVFLHEKAEMTLNKLNSGDKLPLLATPTHTPFFVSAESLVNSLLAYEKAGKEPHLEDLIVACNRLLPIISEEAKTLAKKLKGKYTDAINYYLGNSKEIKPTQELMPLWAQITRITNINTDLSSYFPAEIAVFPSVGLPLNFEIKIEEDKYSYGNGPTYTWYRLRIDKDKNLSTLEQNVAGKKRKKTIDRLYYNAGETTSDTRSDVAYRLSLNPYYLDGFLCGYAPTTAQGNEVAELEWGVFPMEFLVENNLRVHHSGWIYVAVCLLFEKKPSRDLANEFVLQSIARGQNLNYLAKLVGILLAGKYAPVNRFIEYLDRPLLYKEVKDFQREALEQFFIHLDLEKQPTNTKKLITYYEELLSITKVQMPKEIADKVSQLTPKSKKK